MHGVPLECYSMRLDNAAQLGLLQRQGSGGTSLSWLSQQTVQIIENQHKLDSVVCRKCFHILGEARGQGLSCRYYRGALVSLGWICHLFLLSWEERTRVAGIRV